MADPPTDTGSISPESLDVALAWIQRNLDDLQAAERRRGEPAGAVGEPVAGTTPGPSAAIDATLGPSAAIDATAGGPAASPPATVPVVAPAGPATRTAAPTPSGAAPTEPAAAPATPADAGPSATPLLDKIGRDLTSLAAQGLLSPVIGRTEETDWLIEVLCRRSKRNPVLLGPAGSGKTAIVEGLAQRIASGRVPAILKGTRLIEVPLSGIVAGTQYRGQLEERLDQLVAEASQPGIVLFFDEVHLLVGAGTTEGGSMGADQVLKPALARGDIAVIGATTPEEYRATIERDTALARRFTTIDIRELDLDATRPILRALRDGLQKGRGVRVSDAAIEVLLTFADEHILNRRFPDKAIDLLEQAVAHALVTGRTSVGKADAVTTTQVWASRASSTPTLDRYGRDLVALARAGKLRPIIGRDRELQTVEEILLRKTKRNPLLLGPAGAGKTAIVEGLASRIATGDVPAPLRDLRLYDVPLLELAAALRSDPSRLADLLLEARHPSVVVFFDEIHVLATPAVGDLAESLKPALARGEMACIGATTGEEYQALLEPEAALARRFTPVAVEPMDEASVHAVLVSVRDGLARSSGVHVDDAALDELVSLAGRYFPNRSFPDKGVDLIEQAVARGVDRGIHEIDPALARSVVADLVGMPLDPTDSLAHLRTALAESGVFDAGTADRLTARLGVTLRGLDAGNARPDAVILLAGSAASAADRLAASLAETLFGRRTAVVDVELSGMTEDSSISTLLGSAPGLVGSERPLPLQELRRAPWQVVVLRSVDQCAGSIRETIASALEDGSFTDSMGRRLPLGSSVVVLTARGAEAGADASAIGPLAASLGRRLVEACDVVVAEAAGQDGQAASVQRTLLDPLARRFASVGVDVRFDTSFVTWLVGRLPKDGESPEAFLDRAITPALVGSLPAGATGEYEVRVDGERPVLVPVAAPGKGSTATS
jgi:ATP-dependent Clp protease ATP-binding subunit ClpC